MSFRTFLWDHPSFRYSLRILLIVLLGAGFVILTATIVRSIPDPTYSITVVDAKGNTVFEQSGTDKITTSMDDDVVIVSTKGKTYTFKDASIKEASNTVKIQSPSDTDTVEINPFLMTISTLLACILGFLITMFATHGDQEAES